MQIKLSENIRRFRKERGLTQEMLAEALNVTVGAVYKWESGRSLPEIDLMVELADLFETSVDVLLGYEIGNNDREHVADRLKGYLHGGAQPDALTDAEKAIKNTQTTSE